MSKAENPLVLLKEAEERAAATIRAEEKARQGKLQSAETRALEDYEAKRDAEIKKFQAESEQDGGNNEALNKLIAETEQQKQQQSEAYQSSKDDVINMLLHFVTTCDINLEESQRQAYISLGRKAYNPDA